MNFEGFSRIRSYEGNQKKYEENMKKYEGNMKIEKQRYEGGTKKLISQAKN